MLVAIRWPVASAPERADSSSISNVTGSSDIYHSRSLAAKGHIVVVTINYRTNIFGFPGSSDLPITQNNLGLLDQELALEWVQLNIARFGGDPDKVTIMVRLFCFSSKLV